MSLDLESNKQQINIKEVKSNDPLIYEFEDFCLDAEHLMLSRGGEEISLTPKVVETLLAIVERHGEIISKDELMQRVWGDAFVEESNLVQNIYVLRKALGTTKEGAPMIETLRRRGYRFNGLITEKVKERRVADAVEAVADVQEETVEVLAAPKVQAGSRRFFAVGMIVGCGLIALTGFTLARLLGVRNTIQAAAPESLNITFKRLTPDLYTRSPVVSPDGKYLAYSQIEHNKESIWVKDLISEATVQLLPPVDLDQAYNVFQFSPDGAQLYYSTTLPNAPNRSIFRYTLSNRQQVRIADDDISPGAISPDGSQLAFINDKYELVIIDTNGTGQRKAVRTRNENEWLVAWDSQMSWSPDGMRIALCGGHDENGRSVGDLIDLTIADGSERRFAVPADWQQIDDAIWLADGNSLLVTARKAPAEPFQIYRVSSIDGSATRITNDNHGYSWISVSKDAGIVVTEQDLGHFNIWTAPFSDPMDIKQLTFGNAAEDGYDGLAFMPDGKIIYSATRSGAVDLWTMDSDGNGQKQLTSNSGIWNGRPRVTPDGRYIIFSSTRAGIAQLWRMDADGGNPTQLTTGPDPAYRATISSDGNWVYYNTEHDGSIWKIGTTGGDPALVSKQKCLFPSISPDGKRIACVQVENGGPNKWRAAVLSAENGELLKTFDYPAGRTMFAWSSDSNSLISTTPNWGNLRSYALDDNPTRQLTEFTTDRLAYFAISRDYKQFAFSRGSSFSEAVQLIGSLDNKH